jgi:hypothetical protein
MAGILKTFQLNRFGAGVYLLGKYDPLIAAETIVLAPTTVALEAGTQLGKITASGLYVPIAPGASDGSQNWAGILYERRPINTANQKAVITARTQGVNGNALIYVNTMTGPQKAAAEALMATAGVIVRY